MKYCMICIWCVMIAGCTSLVDTSQDMIRGTVSVISTPVSALLNLEKTVKTSRSSTAGVWMADQYVELPVGVPDEYHFEVSLVSVADNQVHTFKLVTESRSVFSSQSRLDDIVPIPLAEGCPTVVGCGSQDTSDDAADYPTRESTMREKILRWMYEELGVRDTDIQQDVTLPTEPPTVVDIYFPTTQYVVICEHQTVDQRDPRLQRFTGTPYTLNVLYPQYVEQIITQHPESTYTQYWLPWFERALGRIP